MKLTGVVRNIVDFGAFVDIGLKNDGLVHKSQMGRYVSNVFDVLSVGQQIEVSVLEVDMARKRVSLGMKTEGSPRAPSHRKRRTSPSMRKKKEVFEESTVKGNISFS